MNDFNSNVTCSNNMDAHEVITEAAKPPTIISYSEVFKWDTCQRQYWYRFGLGLMPLEESEAITTGTKGHKLLQVFYTAMQQGKTKLEAQKIVSQKAKELMSRNFVVDSAIAMSWTLVNNYIMNNEFNNQAVIVENRFLVPLSSVAPLLADEYNLNHVQIGFTPDVVFERSGKFLTVEDSKFVARAWSKKKINRFQQTKLYEILLKRMGYNVTQSSVRFFNVTTGRITVQNYVLRNEEEAIIIHDFVKAVHEVITFRQQPQSVQAAARRTMNYTICQFCAFEFPCTLEAEGKDASKTFAAEYTKSNYAYSI